MLLRDIVLIITECFLFIIHNVFFISSDFLFVASIFLPISNTFLFTNILAQTPHNMAFELFDMPAEMIGLMTENLNDKDLCSFRETCRLFEQHALRQIRKSLRKPQAFRCNERGLSALVWLSRNLTLCSSLRDITLHGHTNDWAIVDSRDWANTQANVTEALQNIANMSNRLTLAFEIRNKPESGVSSATPAGSPLTWFSRDSRIVKVIQELPDIANLQLTGIELKMFGPEDYGRSIGYAIGAALDSYYDLTVTWHSEEDDTPCAIASFNHSDAHLQITRCDDSWSYRPDYLPFYDSDHFESMGYHPNVLRAKTITFQDCNVDPYNFFNKWMPKYTELKAVHLEDVFFFIEEGHPIGNLSWSIILEQLQDLDLEHLTLQGSGDDEWPLRDEDWNIVDDWLKDGKWHCYNHADGGRFTMLGRIEFHGTNEVRKGLESIIDGLFTDPTTGF